MVALLFVVVLSEVDVVIVGGGWWCVCTPAMMMYWKTFIFVRVKMCGGGFVENFVFWWSGGGVFLPTGSAITFDRDFGHFWKRKGAALLLLFFPLLSSFSSFLSFSVTGGNSPLSSEAVAPRELSLAHGMFCCVI